MPAQFDKRSLEKFIDYLNQQGKRLNNSARVAVLIKAIEESKNANPHAVMLLCGVCVHLLPELLPKIKVIKKKKQYRIIMKKHT